MYTLSRKEVANTLSRNPLKELFRMSFLIKCISCGTLAELEDGFLKRENEIHVYDSGEFLVSIKCTGCGNEAISNYDE